MLFKIGLILMIISIIGFIICLCILLKQLENDREIEEITKTIEEMKEIERVRK